MTSAKCEGPGRTGQPGARTEPEATAEGAMAAEQGAPGCGCAGLLTRDELAVALKVSVRTVDRMLADGEISPVRVRGVLVRFYLPDVVRQLVATALTRKRGPAKERA